MIVNPASVFSRETVAVVSMLSAYEIDNEFHNEGGFPVEDEWARSNPSSFHLLYENSQVRIYAVMLPSRTGA